MNWPTPFDPEVSARLCLTLLHSLWQVALLAVAAGLMERLGRRRSVERSYALHVAALVLSLAALPITFALVDVPRTVSVADQHPAGRVVTTPPIEVPADSPTAEPAPAPRPQRFAGDVAPGRAVPAAKPNAVETTRPTWRQAAPWLAIAYAGGVLLMLTRLLVAMVRAERLRRSAAIITEGPVAESLQALSRQWSVRVMPVLAMAEQVIVPKVVGLLRPTILLPASALSGLSVTELEMIFAHELAHIRRHDLWVHLLERLAEVLLFFNPPLWYLNRRIGSLREYCCDELACREMSAGGVESRTRYAAALLRVVELSQPGVGAEPQLAALAAPGRSPSQLRRRLARLLNEPLRDPLPLSRPGVVTVAALVFALLAGPALWPTGAETVDEPKAAKQQGKTEKTHGTKAFSFGAKVEVVAIGTHQEQPQRWWDPLGKLIDPVPFQWEEAGAVSSPDKQWRRVVYRIEGLPDDADVNWQIIGTDASAGGQVKVDGMPPSVRYFTRYFSIAQEQQSVGLRVRVATGRWKTAAQGDTNGQTGTTTRGNKTVLFSGAVETAGETVVVVSHNIFDQSFRVVAVDKDGQRHVQSGRGGASVGQIYQARAKFPGLRRHAIDHFEFQVRDYESVELKDLPVQMAAGQGPVLRGHVTDESGKPLADVQVILYNGAATRWRGQEIIPWKQLHNRIAPLPDPFRGLPSVGGYLRDPHAVATAVRGGPTLRRRR